MIVCVCRGVSDRQVARAIENGASSIDDLRRCGIGDQCGSCHNQLRSMLAQAAAAAEAATAIPCPACTAEQPAAAAIPA